MRLGSPTRICQFPALNGAVGNICRGSHREVAGDHIPPPTAKTMLAPRRRTYEMKMSISTGRGSKIEDGRSHEGRLSMLDSLGSILNFFLLCAPEGPREGDDLADL